MSGLVKFAKKAFKKVRETTKKVLKSKVFKVVVIAAAVVFTGGAILGAAGALGGGATLGSALASGFQAGMSALGGVGTFLMNNVVQPVINFGQTAFNAATGVFTGGAAAPVSTSQVAALGQAGIVGPPTAALAGTAAPAAAGGGMSALTKAALINTGGNMLSGYAQGRAREEELDKLNERDMRRDRYGMDSYGNRENDLVNPTDRLASFSAPNLNQAPAPTAPTVTPAPRAEAPTSPMRDKLIASLNSPYPLGA